MQKKDKIYIAGHKGMVGSSIWRNLEDKGYTNLIGATHQEFDLRSPTWVDEYFYKHRPEYVFLAAARVGGIYANSAFPVEFLHDNLVIQCNILSAAKRYGVKKLLFLGSSCIYPKICPQPIKEEYLLTGELESTNEPYALAKIAGIRLCDAYNKEYGCNFLSVMPPNLYGPGDSYNLSTSHVLPALIKKIHVAKELESPFVSIWGTGLPLREFMYVDDLAEACVYFMNKENRITGHINIGTGEEVSVLELARIIAGIIGYKGSFKFDSSKPDGTIRKIMDSSRAHAYGWRHTTGLREGIELTYQYYFKSLQ